MLQKTFSKIEIEFRSVFNKKQYVKIQEFLNKNAKDLGKDDQDVCFFCCPIEL